MNPEQTSNSFGYEEAAIVRAMIQHENELRNNRIIWFITIEGLLFAALGFAWKDAQQLIYILCLLGLATALSSSRELKLSSMGINDLKKWWRAWLQQQNPAVYTGPPVIGLDLEGRLKGRGEWGFILRPAKTLPWLFAGAWVLLFLLRILLPPQREVQEVRILPASATTSLPPQ